MSLDFVLKHDEDERQDKKFEENGIQQQRQMILIDKIKRRNKSIFQYFFSLLQTSNEALMLFC